MRIALISFEYPPAVAIGGIGADATEAARMLNAAGHDVEIFAAGQQAVSELGEEGIFVHRVVVANRHDFPMALLPVFSARHAYAPMAIAQLLIELTSSSISYQALAAAGRESVSALLAPSEVLPQMRCYETAIQRTTMRCDD